jgi:GT2 family glycosyltransferase
MKFKNVAIIILNWNGWKDTIECLESVYQNNYPNFNVIIIDNGSTDDSINKIKEYCKGKLKINSPFFTYNSTNKPINYSEQQPNTKKPKNHSNKDLILIKNPKNTGFAEGNNIGAEYALKNLKSHYILLLNSDTIVDINFLSELVKVTENDKNIGSVQSKLMKSDKITFDSLGQQILTWGAEEIVTSHGKCTEDKIEIFGACAAAALYKGDLIKKIGLFDKEFFVLLEDVDLSWRIRLLKLKSFLSVNSVVYHKRGISNTNSINKILNNMIHETEIYELKWYHETKNWLIIFIRYYPLKMIIISLLKSPKRVISTFLLFSYSSIKLKNTETSIKLLQKNIKIRKINKNNYMLKKIQNKWIKNIKR